MFFFLSYETRSGLIPLEEIAEVEWADKGVGSLVSSFDRFLCMVNN